MSKRGKITKFIFNLCKWFLMLLGVGFLFLLIIGSILPISDVDSNKNLKIYKEVHTKVKDEYFVEGECTDNILVLTEQGGKTYEIDLHINNIGKYFHKINKNENGEIVLTKYGGIFDSDYEIVFTDNMYFDQNKYKSIENVDNNIFVCQLFNT